MNVSQLNTAGNAVIVNVGADAQNVAIGTHFSQTIYITAPDRPPQLLNAPPRLDITIPVKPSGPPTVFVGRQEELLLLNRWLDEIAHGDTRERGPRGRLVLLYGQTGIGKRELARQWLAELPLGKLNPIIARTGRDTIGAHLEAGDQGCPQRQRTIAVRCLALAVVVCAECGENG